MRKGSGLWRKPDCHPDRPYFSRGMCKYCYQKWHTEANKEHVKERQAKYAKENREHLKIYLRSWKKTNPQKMLVLRNRYRQKNSASLLDRHRKYNLENRETINKKSKEYAMKYPEKAQNLHLKRYYKITIDEYNVLLEKQERVCAICGGVNKNGRKLYVDHNHDTGVVRGLLCDDCNVGIGRLRDNKDLAYKAYLYLEKHDADGTNG